MQEVIPQLALVAGLVLINGILAGSEIALISLRDSQVRAMERRGGAGEIIAQLTADPNRFLATIQIGITLAGFMASATAAVTLAEPLIPLFGFAGDAADTVAIVAVTLILSFVMLVLGELAPKRLALQRAESWSLLVARPLHWLEIASRPAVWLLSRATDLVVRLFRGEPGASREAVDLEEVKEIVRSNVSLSEPHQEVLVGAVEVADRSLREVLVPRPDVVSLSASLPATDGIEIMLRTGHSRAPVTEGNDLDQALGVANLRDLVAAAPGSRVGDVTNPVEAMPESVLVLSALRRLQEARQQMALVIDEFGGVAGIITIEDLLEEVVGEIYDETDRDIRSIQRDEAGVVVSGRFPVHDLVDLGIQIPPGDYTTVSGFVQERLGAIPEQAGESFVVGRWRVTVLGMRGRAVDRARFERIEGPPPVTK